MYYEEKFRCPIWAFYLSWHEAIIIDNDFIFRCSLFWAFYLYGNHRNRFQLHSPKVSMLHRSFLFIYNELKNIQGEFSISILHRSFLFICRDSLHRKCNCFQCVSMLYQSFLFISKTNFDKIFNKVFRCSVFWAFYL